MDPKFWLERWSKREIGFHQNEPHRALDLYWHGLDLPRASRVFVPLAGKSLDLRWLAAHGHRVVAIELAETAVREFFAEAELTPTESLDRGLRKFSAGPYEFYCGDYFALHAHHLTDVRGIFDRAALVALPPAMRIAYARQMSALASPACKLLLVTLEYDQSRMPGPPHAVLEHEVRALFADWQACALLERSDELARSAKFRERGLTELNEAAFALTR